jgi:hypothetical protein
LAGGEVTMRLGAAAMLSIASVALVLGPPVAEARRPTYVSHDCKQVKIKPRSILFACADGGYFVKRLRWRSWWRSQAVGRGVFHFNDCEPSCAEGTFHKRRGRLILHRRRWCKNVEKFVFKRAKIRYRRPWRGTRRYSWRLGCPL